MTKTKNSLIESFFDETKLKKEPNKDEVMEEFKNLNKTIMSITKGNGRIHAIPIAEDEADSIFEGNRLDTSFYIVFRYSVPDDKKILHWYRNKFTCVSYNETFPVWILDLKNDDADLQKFEDKESFHNFIKKMVNKESFLRSLRRAINGKVNIEDDFSD